MTDSKDHSYEPVPAENPGVTALSDEEAEKLSPSETQPDPEAEAEAVPVQPVGPDTYYEHGSGAPDYGVEETNPKEPKEPVL